MRLQDLVKNSSGKQGMASNDSQGESSAFKLKLGQTDIAQEASSDDDDTSSEEEESESMQKPNVVVNEASDLVNSEDSEPDEAQNES